MNLAPRTALLARLAIFSGLTSALVSTAATPITWSNTGTAWATPANWLGGTAPANDLTTAIALFNSATFTAQPNFGTTSVNGLAVGDDSTATGPLTLTGTILTLGDGGITIHASAGTVSLANTVKLGANQNWANNSSSLFTVGANISNTGNLTPFTLTLNGTGSGGTTLSGGISDGGTTGTTALVVNTTGTGITTLTNNNNNFTGGVTLNSGILRATTTGSLSTGTLTLNGGQLQLISDTVFAAFVRPTTVGGDAKIIVDRATAGAGVYSVLGALSLDSHTLTVTSGTTLTSGSQGLQFQSASLTGNGTFNVVNSTNGLTTLLNIGTTLNLGANTLTVDGNGTFSVNGVISGSGALTFASTFTGTATLGGISTYAGGTNANGGTLAIVNASSFGTGLLTMGGASFTGGGNITVANALAITGNTAISTPTNFLYFSGNGTVSNSPVITVNSGSQLTFTGALTFNSDLGVAGSQLIEFRGGLITTGNANRQFNSTITAALGTSVTTGGLSGAGSFTLNANGTTPIKITGPVSNTGTVTNSGSSSGVTTISGVIDTPVTGIIQNSATSMLVLSGTNIFTSGLTIQQGTVQLGSTTGLGSGTVTIGGTGTSGTLDLNGLTATIIGLVSAGTPANQTIGNSSTSTAAILSYTGSTTSTFDGVIKDVVGTGNKTTGLTVNNAAANLTLTGANTYTGATTVTAGTLAIGSTGSLAAGSAVTVNGGSLIDAGTINGTVTVSSGSLGGTGTVNGATTVSATGGVKLADGSLGTLTFGTTLAITGAASTNNLTFDLGSTAGTSDKIAVTGAFSMTTSGAGVITLNQLGGIPSTYGTSTLITAASGLTAGGGNFTLATTKAFGETFTLGGTTTALTVTTAAGTTGPATAWWKGGVANWSTAANWNTDATSSVAAGAAPGYQTNVNFATTTPAATTLANTIDVDFDINSLNFAPTTTSNVSITGSKMLTIEATAANGNAAGNGITVNTPNSGTPLVTISAKVGLAADQTWTVNNGAALTVSGVITDFGAGKILTKAGAGLLTLSGANAFGTATTINVNAGTLTLSLTGVGGNATFNLGDTNAGSNNATLNLFGTANSVVVRSGNSGTATIGSVSAGSNVAVTIPQLTLNKAVILSPGNQTANMNITSLTGTGDMTVKALGAVNGTVNYGMLGGGVNLTAPNTSYSGATSVLAGTLTLTGAGVNMTSWLGTNTSDIVMGDTSGIQSAKFLLSPSVTGAFFTRGFTIQAGNGGISAVGVTANSGGTFSGNFTLNKSVYILGPNSSGAGGAPTTFSGVFAKGSGVIDAVSVISSGDRNGYSQLTNSGNTYDGGTVIGSGILVASSGSLGSGNVDIQTGALRLAATNALASTKTVHVGSLGALSIGANTMDQTYLQSVIDATSSGAVLIGMGATAYTNNLDLATLGNGLMYLGADQAAGGVSVGGTYSGTTLGASGGVYRLGFGGTVKTLTITNGVLGGANQLIVGGSLGYVYPGTAQGLHTEGIVVLNAANAYSGGTIVNSRSQLQGLAQASGSPFGTGAITLHNSSLRLLNNGTTVTSTTTGNVDFDGAATIQADSVTGGNNTLSLGTLTRNTNGTVTIATTGTGAVLGSTAKIKTSSTLATTAINTTAGAATMVDAYFTDSTGNYLTYDATNGFTSVANAFATLGTATGSNSIVKTAAADTTASTKTIAALMIGGAGGNITNGTGSNVTLTIASGGVSMNGSAATVIGSGTAGQNIILDFATKEAVFTGTGGQQLTITNEIKGTGGLTKSGSNLLVLLSTANSFTGDITINQGSIQVNNDAALGNLTNDIVLNGGALLTGNTNSGASITLNAGRTIKLGEAGGTLYTGGDGGTNGFNLTVAGQVTGTGAYLALSSSQSLTFNTASTLPVVTIALTDATNDFTAPIYLGYTGGPHVALAFSDDHQLGNSTNSVSLIGGNAILQYTGVASTSTGRSLNFLDQGGSIDVVNAVTLTASGTISGSGMFNKNGLGTLALTGSAAAYSGTVNVNAGVLNVSNADALGATTAAITGTSGVSGGATYVQSGAALEVQSGSGIALGNAGGKTLYLNGGGIGNAGALRNISGANSNAGQVIFQSNTIVGVDAGSLTLSGIVSGSGALTKVGAGSLALTAASNTYTGATTVSAGDFRLGGNIGSSALTVASGASLTVDGPRTVASATFNSGSTINLDVAPASASDKLTSFGAVAFNGTLNLNFTGTFSSNTTISLFSGTSYSGSFSSIVASGAYSGSFSSGSGAVQFVDLGGNTITFNNATGDLSFTAAAIPEPATAAALAATALLAFAACRRRQRRC